MKKRIIIIPLITVALILIAGATYFYFDWMNGKKEYNACNVWKLDESRSCASDDECTIIDITGCGGPAVNKAAALFLEQRREKCKGFWPQASCAISDQSVSVVPRCKAGKCVVESK